MSMKVEVGRGINDDGTEEVLIRVRPSAGPEYVLGMWPDDADAFADMVREVADAVRASAAKPTKKKGRKR